jgi:hypothetical protein
MKGSKCINCGYDKHLSALAFHHKDPSTKLFQLDLRTCSNQSLDKLLIELEKCDLYCMNCHTILHYDLDNAPGKS